MTLASSTALRLEPTLQFLQLLSALDIASVAGATALALEVLAGRRAGWAGGTIHRRRLPVVGLALSRRGLVHPR